MINNQNTRQNLINNIKKNNYSKNSKIITKFFEHINEPCKKDLSFLQATIEKDKSFSIEPYKNDFIDIDDEFFSYDKFFSYKELICYDLYTPKIKFGKFFKQIKGIQNSICHIYLYKELNEKINGEKLFKKCLIFDIQVYENKYYCYIEINNNEGCPSCGMNHNQDIRMYISYNLDMLILNSLLLTSFCFE